ncbi:unnamed protein product [Lampetra fluviatilis]
MSNSSVDRFDRICFGDNVDTIEQGTLRSIRLQTMAPVGSLTSEKLLSLPKKYFSIPPEYLPHYRAIASEISSQIEDPIQQTVPHPLEQTPACFD